MHNGHHVQTAPPPTHPPAVLADRSLSDGPIVPPRDDGGTAAEMPP